MRKSYAQLRESTTYDALVKELRRDFEKIPDHRAANVVHKLPNILMSGYAIFTLKYPSLLCFEQQTLRERENLRQLFGIDKICSDVQMRRVLDELDPDQLQPLFGKHFEVIKRTGLLGQYRFMKKYLLASSDGVHYFQSNKVNCKRCLVNHHQNGVVSYNHSMLGVALVHPAQREVYPIGCEAIQKQDGQNKNDCELNAARRLQKRLFEDYKDLPLLLLEDALYANEPHLEQILDNGWDFITNVKPSSHKALFTLFKGRRARGQINTLIVDEGKTQHHFYWMNNVSLNGKGNLRVNFLYYEQHNAKGKAKTFSWCTSIKLRKSNVYEVMRGGRCRWKIENEGFNTLKNQGYHFEHNYGHGYNHLSNVMALLMLLSFLIDQLVQACSKRFNNIWKAAKAKKRVWERIRALFMIQPINSFNELFDALESIFIPQLE